MRLRAGLVLDDVPFARSRSLSHTHTYTHTCRRVLRHLRVEAGAGVPPKDKAAGVLYIWQLCARLHRPQLASNRF